MGDLTRYVLEDRICKCGCGEKFKCLSTSKQEFASKKCESYNGKFGTVKKELRLSPEDEKELAKINRLFDDRLN